MAEPERPPVERVSLTERAVHWIHAAAFFALAISGVALYLPDLAGALGSRATVKDVHVYVALTWAVVLLAVVAVGDRRALSRTVREIERFDLDDRGWLRGRGTQRGRFNAGQKLHAIVQAAFAALFVISGALLLLGERQTSLRLPGTIVLHDTLTLAAGALVLGHVYLALIHPPTRPALRGMIGGAVDEKWVRRQHRQESTRDRGVASGHAGDDGRA